MEYKQVILVRQDLKLPKGKLAAQVAHAAVEACFKSEKQILTEWHHRGQKKVTLKVKDEKELLKYLQLAKDAKLVTALITDAGRTVVAPGTKTVLGIGPDEEDKIDAVTSELKML